MTYGPPPEPPPPPPPAYGYQPYPAQHYGYTYGAAPQVRAGYTYAGFWIRFLAYLIDAIVLDVPLYGLAFALFGPQLVHISCSSSVAFGNTVGTGCTGTVDASFFLATLGVQAVHFVYFVLLWSLTGASIGQRALALIVVDADTGGRISIGRAALRFLGYIINGIVFDLGYMWAGWDPRKQGWHDKLARTFVLRPL